MARASDRAFHGAARQQSLLTSPASRSDRVKVGVDDPRSLSGQEQSVYVLSPRTIRRYFQYSRSNLRLAQHNINFTPTDKRLAYLIVADKILLI